MYDAFFLLGLTIILGWISVYVLKKYYISQVLLLMLFGFLLGPVFNVVDISEQAIIRAIYPFMSVLALIILLFDAGISFKLHNIFQTLNKTTIFACLVFILSVLFTLILMPILNLDILHAMIIGATLGGTSSAIVVSMLEPLKVPDETSSLVILESVITDVLVIISVFVLIQISQASVISFNAVLNDIVASFAIAIIFGAFAAYAWYKLMSRLPTFGFDYMLTLAVLFIVYAANEAINSSGGLSVFVFSLAFANFKQAPEYFSSERKPMEEKKIRTMQYEITFFVRTFFFTYIGLLYPLFKFDFVYFIVSILLVALYLAARYIVFKYMLIKNKKFENIIVFMFPRGLAAAVMVGIVASSGIIIPGFEIIAFTVIFLTNLIATIAVFVKQRETNKKFSEEESAEIKKKK